MSETTDPEFDLYRDPDEGGCPHCRDPKDCNECEDERARDKVIEMAAPHPITPPGVVRDTYLQRELAVREYAEALKRAAGQVLEDLDRGRVPRLRSALDDASRLAAHIEVMTALSALQAREG